MALDLPYVAFDIETVPMPGCESFVDMNGISAPSNYKDEAKIAAYIAAEKKKRIERAGLDMDLCEIAAIGWEDQDAQGGVVLRQHFDEDQMLKKFWSAAEGSALVGFNIWHFDLPVLVRRSLYLGVSVPNSIRLDSYKPDGVAVLDVAHVLSFGRRDLLKSLGFYCQRFGISHDDSVTGADIAALVAAGEWAKVSSHCYSDVFSTRLLAQRIGLVRGMAVAA